MKKTISILLALITIMNCSLFSAISVFASEKVASGIIKGQVSWDVTDGTLNIKSAAEYTGVDISDYSTDIHPGWYNYRDKIKNIIIGKYVEEIGNYAFYGLNNVKTVTIGGSVTKIGTGCFARCDNITNFKIPGVSRAFKTEDGVLFTMDGKELVAFPPSKEIKSNDDGVAEYVIPSSVSIIRAYSFYRNKNIEKITNDTPGSITKINTHAFAYSEKLKTVVIKNNCKSIQNKAFYGANELTSLTIPPSVNEIGEDILSHSESLNHALRIHCAKGSAAYTQLKGKGYILSDREWTFTVKFDPTDGVCSMVSKTVVWGDNYGELPTSEKTGYSFAGWYSGDKNIKSSTKVSEAKNHTLIAKYESKNYTVALNANNGICDTQNITVSFGKPIGYLPEASRIGYRFLGWYAESGDKVYTDTIFNDEKITSLVARYSKIVSVTSGLKIKYKTKNTVELSWAKQDDITGYEVFQKTNDENYVNCATVTENSAVLNLKPKNTYKFKVRAFLSEGDSSQFGAYSSEVSRKKTFVAKPILKKSVGKSGMLSVKWKSISNAKKYQIFQYKNKKWKKVRTTTATKFYIYTKHGKTYRFKVRAYTTALKHRFFGKFGKVKYKG